MSYGTRIDPNHPLTRAARENNAYADTHGAEAALKHIGMVNDKTTMANLFYLAEQRALRVFAAQEGEVNPTGPVRLTDEQKALMPILISAYLDGMAIGWRAQALVWNASKLGFDALTGEPK